MSARVKGALAGLMVVAAAQAAGAQAANANTKTAAKPAQQAPTTKAVTPAATKTAATTPAATKAAPTTQAPAATKAAAPAAKATAQVASQPAAKPVAGAFAISPSLPSVRFSSRGETFTLSARVADRKTGRPVAKPSIMWRSSAPSVATVTPAGLVTAVNNGSAQVWAISGMDSVPVAVFVVRRTSRLGFSPSQFNLDAIGAWTPFRVEMRDAKNQSMPDDRGSAPVCRSRNDDIATLSANGRVTARSNGLTWIICAKDNLRDSVSVVVRQRAARAQIVADGPTFVLKTVGDSLRLGMIAVDRLGETINDGWVTWVSEEPAIAHVDISTGVVIGVSVGSTMIIGKIDDYTDSILVTVKNPLPRGAIASRGGARMPSRLPDPARNVFATLGNSQGAPVAQPASTGGSAPPRNTQQLDKITTVEVKTATASRTLALADTLQLIAVPKNSQGDPFAGKTILWKSLDSLSEVTSDGRLVAKGIGTTRVSASVGDVTGAIALTVIAERSAPVAAAPSTSAAQGGATLPPATGTRAALPATGASLNRRNNAVSASSPRNAAIADSIIRTDIIGVGSLLRKPSTRSFTITPMAGFVNRREDKRSKTDDTTKVDARGGLAYGARVDIQPAKVLNLRADFLMSSLSAENSLSLIAQDFAQLRGTLEIVPQSWLALQAAYDIRGFKNAIQADVWKEMRVGGELRFDFVGNTVRGVVGGAYIPSTTVNDGKSAAPDLGVGGHAGVEWNGRRFSAGVRYDMERYDFPDVGTAVHKEQFSGLLVRLGIAMGR